MADAKVIVDGSALSGNTTAIPDNNVSALDIESTDGKDVIFVSTVNGEELTTIQAGDVGIDINSAGQTKCTASNTWMLLAEDATATNPNLLPHAGDQDTGIGRAAVDQLSLIAGGVEIARAAQFDSGTFQNVLAVGTDIADIVSDLGGSLHVRNDSVGAQACFQRDSGKLIVEASGANTTINSNVDMRLQAGSGVDIFIKSDSGNVGIQTTAPVHQLHVQDGDLGIVTNSADDVAKSLVFTKSKNDTDGGHTAVDDDTVLGNIVFEGSDSTGAFEPGAKIRAQVAAGTIGDGRIPTELIFSTAPDSASAPLDALVINPSGFVQVQSPTNGARFLLMDGATERAGFKAFSDGLYVDTANSSHDMFFRPGGSTTTLCIDAGNTFVGILDVTPTKALDVKNGESGGDILCHDIYTHDGGVTSSDERMKENIVETTLGLDFINTLSPVSYKWKDTDEYTEMRTVPGTDGEPEHEEVANTFGAVQYTRTHHGLIAQQVNQAVIDAGLTATEFAGYTYDSERDQHGLRYQEFISPLIKAVQELTSQNESLAARIATLEAGD